MDTDCDSIMYKEVKSPIYRVNTNEFKNNKVNRIKYWVRNDRIRWMSALFFGSTSLYLSRTILPLVSVGIVSELNWDHQSMGTVMGAFFWGYMATNFAGGYLSDIIGGEYVVMVAGLAWALVTLVFPFLPSIITEPNILFYSFILMRALLGCCQGFYFPSVGSLMAHRVKPEERQFTYSVLCSGTHMGTLLCGSLGSVMMKNMGWRSPFYVIALYGILWALLTRHILMAQRQRIIEYRFDVEAVQNAIERESIPWRRLLTHPAFWAMLFGHFCHSNCFVVLLNWLPTYFHDNYPSATSWVFNVVPWSVTMPSVIVAGWLGDYLMRCNVSLSIIRKLMTTMVLLVSSIFLICLSMTTDYSYALFCMAACMASNGFHVSGILLNPQDLAPKFGGTVFGLTNMVGAIPGFASVYLVGYILDTTKSWPTVFLFTAALNVIGWFVYMVAGTAKRIA